MSTLRLRRPKPPDRPAPQIALGKRPGVAASVWFDEVYYLDCSHSDWRSLERNGTLSTIDSGYQGCHECGYAWRVGQPRPELREPCGDCVRRAYRLKLPLPEAVPLHELWICRYCGKALCKAHIYFDGYGEETEYVCRSCARAQGLRTNRDFGEKVY